MRFGVAEFNRLIKIGERHFAIAAGPPRRSALRIEPPFLGIGLDQLVIDLDRFGELERVDFVDQSAAARMRQNDEPLLLLADNRQQFTRLNDIHQVIAEFELHLHTSDARLMFLSASRNQKRNGKQRGEEKSGHGEKRLGQGAYTPKSNRQWQETAHFSVI